MTNPVVVRRRAEQARLVATAAEWASRAGPALGAQAVVVVGSVARGDFNKWSDIDVLVVAEELPATWAERSALVGGTHRPPGVEVIAWTPTELVTRLRRGTDPLATEAYGPGVVVFGELPPR